jgi:hypothetical protein
MDSIGTIYCDPLGFPVLNRTLTSQSQHLYVAVRLFQHNRPEADIQERKMVNTKALIDTHFANACR